MYIKEIMLEGFMSYKELSVITLDRKHTVILGKNGSGKSNIYKAIAFVLSVNRQYINNYKYRGSTALEKLSTFVELTIDNADRHFPLDEGDIRIRRSLIDSKDQYTVNGEKYSKFQMVNLLQIAGLSTTNSNYIVKEGQITKIANSSDTLKMKLLYEAIGGRQFDEHFKKIGKMLESSENATLTIASNLQVVQKRQRRIELKAGSYRHKQGLHQEYDNLINFIHDLNKHETLLNIQQLERRRVSMENDGDGLISEVCLVTPSIVHAQQNYDEKMEALQLIQRQQEVHFSNIQCLNQERVELEITLTKLRQQHDDFQRNEEEKQRVREECEELRQDNKQRKTRINIAHEQSDMLKDQQHRLNLEYEEVKAQHLVLLDKYSKVKTSTTKSKRDKDIVKRIESLNKKIEDIDNSILKRGELLLKEADEDSNELSKELRMFKRERRSLKMQLEEYSIHNYQQMKEADNLKYKMMELSRNIKLAYAQYESLTVQLPKVKLIFHSLVHYKIWEGEQSLKKILDNYRAAGKEILHHNRVIDNFSCDPIWHKALEKVADEGLFYHIFDRKKIVLRIIRKMNSTDEFRGFIGWLSLDNINLPRRIVNMDYEMLIDKLTFDPKYNNVMQLIFGNTAIVDEINLTNHKQLLRTGLNFVTKDGQYLSARGAYSSANISQHSVIEVTRRLQFNTNERLALKQEIDDMVEQLEEYEQKLNTVYDKKPQVGQVEVLHKRLIDKIRLCETQIRTISTFAADLENGLDRAKEIVHGYINQREEFEKELNAKWTGKLTFEEEQLLRSRLEKMWELQKEVEKNKAECEALGTDQQREILFDHIVMLRVQEYFLESKIQDFESDIKRFEDQMILVEENLKMEGDALSDTTKKIGEHTRQLRDLEMILDRWLEKRTIHENKLSILASELKSNTQEQQRLRDLPEVDNTRGPVSQNVSVRYQHMDRNQLNVELKHIGNQLDRHPPVDIESERILATHGNALNDFLQRADVQEIDYELLESIMARCYIREQEVITASVAKITTEFERIFKRYVPEGSGYLMLTPHDDEIGEGFSIASSMLSVTASHDLQIKVKFARGETVKDLIRLSGGQKSVVALSFLLALQTINPAPFYFFDEVDHALDTQYRAVFGDVVRELKERAQFVMTSFWPEQMQLADKLFYVECINTMSHVKEITYEDAVRLFSPSHE